MSEFEAEVKAAREAAREAGKLLEHYYRKGSYKVGSKGKKGPVTSADLAADRKIKQMLTGAFPEYGWLSEETVDNRDRLKKARVWIVDPLDGTREFINKIPEFSVAIALAEKGEPVVGVTYNPITDEMFWAAREMGCYLGKQRVRVSRTRILKRATILASRSETARGEWEVYKGEVKVSPTGSVAYKLARVAAGLEDATFTRSPESEWDIASGAALIAEAGGHMTDIHEHEIRFNQRKVTIPGMIVSNANLYDQVAELAHKQLKI